MLAERARLREAGKKLVFTNGAFDILHAGHVTYLQFARAQGDALCVGLNSDASVKRYKGEKRPVNPQEDRALVLAALECVDYVVIFDEDEPKELIAQIVPDVLVKGADWAHYVSGREIVEASGGRVVLAQMVEGRSTTNVIRRIVEVYGSPQSVSASASVSQSASFSKPIPYFAHEKLDCYQVGVEFIAWVNTLCRSQPSMPRELRIQLERAALSVILNTAEGNGKRERAIRSRYFDDARGSANECATCLDAAVASGVFSADQVAEGKEMLARIAAMLTKLMDRFSSVNEASGSYAAETETDSDSEKGTST
jgi:D-beta-D-heptose 7-phosphate kinase/D-beta-D-heptose 1-phosphate adenosyltransferase